MTEKKRKRRHLAGTGIKDVAQEAGVSAMSVSRAMRGVEGVSQETRARIMTAAEKLRYSPSSVAGALATANSTLIGVSVPTLDDSVFGDIFTAMRSGFLRHGYQTVFDTTNYEEAREEEWVRRMIAWRPAGIVLSGVNHSETTRKLLRQASIPTLEIWAYSDDPIDICIGIDHFDAGYRMGCAMRDLGYVHPAYVGPVAMLDRRADQRREGIAHAFAERGIQLTAQVQAQSLDSFEGGLSGTADLLGSASTCPDVIFYLNDHMAFGGMMECQTRGLSAPDDVGIVGFNGLRLNSVLPTPITTAHSPRRIMGERGAEMLIARMHSVVQEKAVRLDLGPIEGGTTKQQVQQPA